MAHDVFISYSRKDTDLVNVIEQELKARGIRCFVDRSGINLGDDFAEIISKAIFECKIMLFVWSEYSNQSENTANEIALAIEFGKTIVPFKIGGFQSHYKLAYRLVRFNRIDVLAFNHDKAIELADKLAQQLGLTVSGAQISAPQKQTQPPPPSQLIPKIANENITKFTPKTISLNELNVVHSPLSKKDYFQSSAKVMENMSMLQMGEWLFFSNPKDFKLYKIKVNGEGLSPISKGVVHRKSLFGNYVYFVDEGRSNYIFRTDGDECKMFIDVNIQFPFTLTPKGLAYSQRGYKNPILGNSSEKFVLIDYKGNIVNEENFFAPNLCSDGNYVFFTKEYEGASLIYCADFDGTNVQKICDENTDWIVGLSKGFIYFINKDDGNHLYKVYADGSQLTRLKFSENFNLAVIQNDSLYYNDMYSGIIKRHLLEKAEDELLLQINGKTTNIFNVFGNWIFILIESREQNECFLCRMSLTDGVFETIAKL